MGELTGRVANLLRSAGNANAEREAAWLIEAATGMRREELITSGTEVDVKGAERALSLGARRAAGEPLQYVTGLAGFRRLDLEVGPGVFIPRPETETVVERAMALLPRAGTAVDVGTGSGAIALALANERPDATVFATESSHDALAWAAKNKMRLGLDVTLIGGSGLEGLPQAVRGDIDVVVSNPPYVATDDRASVSDEVLIHEPHSALFAGPDGMGSLRAIATEARAWLKKGGWIVLEIGERQGEAALALLSELGYEGATIHSDLAGRPRIARGRQPR